MTLPLYSSHTFLRKNEAMVLILLQTLQSGANGMDASCNEDL